MQEGFWMRFIPGLKGGLVLETSWLPGFEYLSEEIRRELRALGFRRGKDGSCRAPVPEDELGARRMVTRVFGILLTEAP